MAKRYRTFKRIRMTPASAEKLVKDLVDSTFKEHFGVVCQHCSGDLASDSNYCSKCERETKPKRKGFACDRDQCVHVASGTLACARFIEAGMKISPTRAYLDLSGDDPDLLRFIAKRVREFALKAGKSASAYLRVAQAAEEHARRGWLHLLAECALDVDEEHLDEDS